MSWVVGNVLVGRDNRAFGSPAGPENLVAGTASPPPDGPAEIGSHGSATTPTSITRSGDTATVNYNSHGFSVGDVVRISGAAQAQYNGKKYVRTVPNGNSFTFDVYGTPTTPATGTLTVAGVLKSAKGD